MRCIETYRYVLNSEHMILSANTLSGQNMIFPERIAILLSANCNVSSSRRIHVAMSFL